MYMYANIYILSFPSLKVKQIIYSRTSHKRLPNMSSPGGRLREVVAYESLDHIGSKLCLISMESAETYPCFKCCIHAKSQFIANKIRYFPLRNFPSLVLHRNAIMQQLIIQFLPCYLSNGRLQEVKNKRKFQTFSSKSGRGLL